MATEVFEVLTDEEARSAGRLLLDVTLDEDGDTVSGFCKWCGETHTHGAPWASFMDHGTLLGKRRPHCVGDNPAARALLDSGKDYTLRLVRP